MKISREGVIRLGFPRTFTCAEGRVHYAGWFWGERQLYESCYTVWTTKNLEYAESKNFEGLEVAGSPNWWFHPEESLSYGFEKEYFEQGSAEDYMVQSKTFLIPIDVKAIYASEVQYLEKVRLPEKVERYVKEGKAKLLFFAHEEGVLGREQAQYIQKFCKNHSFDSRHVFLSTCNLDENALDIGEPKLFSYRMHPYFEEELWFLKRSKIGNDLGRKKIAQCISGVPEKVDYKFLCLNRRHEASRTYMVGFLKAFEEKTKACTSLGTGHAGFGYPETGNECAEKLETVYLKGKYLGEVVRYYRNIGDNIALHSPDNSDYRILNNRVDLSESLYRNAYVTVVTETFVDDNYLNNTKMFFSEKTFKPIYSLRPFIIVGTVGSLKQLRQLGYKTFSNWWDESYDEIECWEDRVDAICDLIYTLSQKTEEEFEQMLFEMKDTLVYNYNVLLRDKRLRETFAWFRDIQKIRVD